MRSIIKVTIETDGKEPTWREMQNRNELIGDLADQNMGNFKWAGQGKGSMAFAFEVHNVKEAQRSISQGMFKHLPGWKHSTEVRPLHLAHTLEMHTQAPRRRDLRMQYFNGQRGMGI